MKTILVLLLSCIFLVSSCSNNKTDATKNTSADTKIESASQPTTSNQETANNQQQATGNNNGIIGTWKLQLDAFDDNNNGLLDPEERAKATPNNTSYQFKPDGSCVIQGMFRGRYELKNENGKDNVIVYREKIAGEEDDDPKPEKFRILSVSNAELVLLMQESYNENTIWIFKRV